MQADLSYTNWTSFQELKIESRDSAITQLTATPTTHNWRESYRAALGANYQLNDQFIVRGGMAFDTTPIRSSQVKADFPFANYKALSLGATYNINNDMAVDMGVQHTLKQERDINNLDQSSGTSLNGKMTTEVTSFALGLRMAI